MSDRNKRHTELGLKIGQRAMAEMQSAGLTEEEALALLTNIMISAITTLFRDPETAKAMAAEVGDVLRAECGRRVQ